MQGARLRAMEDRVKPSSLQEWVTFAREVLELRDGEAEVYGTARVVEDENRELLRSANATRRPEVPPPPTPADP
jgi:hypothetical protein